MSNLQDAIRALQKGHVVLLYDADDREGETDLVVASEFASSEKVLQLRTDGGGLLCTTVSPEHHHMLGLPYLADLLRDAEVKHPVLRTMRAHDLRYDASKSSFGLTINHRDTFTGIPDVDRAKTIQELANFLKGIEGRFPATAQAQFGAAFRSPGHTILLNAAPGTLANRKGHTELATELVRMAGLVPSASICEMLDATTGKALGKKQAQAYAKQRGLVFLEGRDVVTAWQQQAHRTPAPVPTSA